MDYVNMPVVSMLAQVGRYCGQLRTWNVRRFHAVVKCISLPTATKEHRRVVFQQETQTFLSDHAAVRKYQWSKKISQFGNIYSYICNFSLSLKNAKTAHWLAVTSYLNHVWRNLVLFKHFETVELSFLPASTFTFSESNHMQQVEHLLSHYEKQVMIRLS